MDKRKHHRVGATWNMHVPAYEAFPVLCGDPVEAGAAVVPGTDASCVLESASSRFRDDVGVMGPGQVLGDVNSERSEAVNSLHCCPVSVVRACPPPCCFL